MNHATCEVYGRNAHRSIWNLYNYVFLNPLWNFSIVNVDILMPKGAKSILKKLREVRKKKHFTRTCITLVVILCLLTWMETNQFYQYPTLVAITTKEM